MKQNTRIVIGLIVVVLAVFVLWPDLLGKGGALPTFSITPEQPDTMEVPSDIPCQSMQDCLDFAASKGDSTGVQARCDTTCIYIVDNIYGDVQ